MGSVSKRTRKDGQHGDFYAANSDEGLFYYWIRCIKLNYTQLLPTRIQTLADVTHHPNYVVASSNSNATTTVIVVGDKRLAKVKEVNATKLPSCGSPSYI